jgi:hypothetical protein
MARVVDYAEEGFWVNIATNGRFLRIGANRSDPISR